MGGFKIIVNRRWLYRRLWWLIIIKAKKVRSTVLWPIMRKNKVDHKISSTNLTTIKIIFLKKKFWFIAKFRLKKERSFLYLLYFFDFRLFVCSFLCVLYIDFFIDLQWKSNLSCLFVGWLVYSIFYFIISGWSDLMWSDLILESTVCQQFFFILRW